EHSYTLFLIRPVKKAQKRWRTPESYRDCSVNILKVAVHKRNWKNCLPGFGWRMRISAYMTNCIMNGKRPPVNPFQGTAYVPLLNRIGPACYPALVAPLLIRLKIQS